MEMKYTICAFPIAELPVPGWECFFGTHDCTFHALIFYVWIVVGNGKTIVIDSGPPFEEADMQSLVRACQTIDQRSILRRLRKLDDIYREAGIRADDVDYLLITQPITYHTGGLHADSFPNAKVCISRAGFFEFLLDNPGHPPRSEYFTETTWNYLRTLLINNKLVLPDSPVEIEPGLLYEPTGGHHPGSAAVRVKTARGSVGILETAFLKKNIESCIPIGVAENTAICRQTIRRYVEECDLVLAAHDNTLLDRFPGGRIA
jgi:glyoxylase-like metal-dependent hydrolase (beta-lactamase superfamily II)